VWPADNAGCGHYRLLFVVDALARQGADVAVDYVGPKVIWNRPWQSRPGPDHQVLGIAEPYPADVVVLQRPSRRWWADIIPYLRAQRVRVVVDVDDRFDAIRKDHVGYADQQGNVVNHRWVDEAARQADLVTVTTPALRDRYGHGHGVVLPNLVPSHYLDIVAMSRPRTLGWSGFVSTHPGDLASTGGGVAQALAQSGWGVFIVGHPWHVAEELGLFPGTDVEPTGAISFQEYPWALAEMELGIVPLEDNDFNRSKSCLKMLEMAALGVPVIASPTPDNARLHRLGIGVPADGRSQWRRVARRLMDNEQMRADLAGKGREVASTLTYDLRCEAWLDAWEGRLRPT
jgi:glycosyltransferase involved in cell wall biosynthesis